MPTCSANKADGARCQRQAQEGSKTCWQHKPASRSRQRGGYSGARPEEVIPHYDPRFDYVTAVVNGVPITNPDGSPMYLSGDRRDFREAAVGALWDYRHQTGTSQDDYKGRNKAVSVDLIDVFRTTEQGRPVVYQYRAWIGQTRTRRGIITEGKAEPIRG